jgi:hypothetical protein
VGNKWKTLGATQGQIRQSVEILCEGKSGVERAEVIDEVVALVQSVGRRPEPVLQANELPEWDEYHRENWARATARHFVEGMLRATERLPYTDRNAVLREMAKWCLWHIPNSRDEVRRLKDWVDILNLKQPHPTDQLTSPFALVVPP